MPDASALTFVLPTLNSELYLGLALESLRPLRHAGAKVIVVDSHSEDRTVEIARAGADQVLFYPKGNMYAAINHGLAAAETEWLAYLNSDDLVFPNALSRAFSALAEDGDLIYGNIDFIDADGMFLHGYIMPPPEDILPLAGLGINAVPPQGALFRRGVFKALGGFDTTFRLSADHDFFVRAALEGYRFRKVATPPLAAFRLHGTQLSHIRHAEHVGESRLTTEKVVRRSTARARWTAYLKFKLRNLGSLAVRFLRGQAIRGGCSIRTCMEL